MTIKVWTAHALVNALVGVVMPRRRSDGCKRHDNTNSYWCYMPRGHYYGLTTLINAPAGVVIPSRYFDDYKRHDNTSKMPLSIGIVMSRGQYNSYRHCLYH